MEYRRQTHAVFYIRYHLVISTKFRRKLFKGDIGHYLAALVRSIQRKHPEIEILEVNTDLDHVHILLSVAPKVSIAQAVSVIKANTARLLKRKFPFMSEGYFDNDTIWSIGYFVSTVSLNEQVIKRYIDIQGKEDSGQAQLVLRDATGGSP
ncbi:MAG: IS200/IS605 family transposase [Parcubacteria group bacterium]